MTTTANTIDLTSKQLVNLLKNVYGLLNEHGEFFFTNESSFDLENEEVELYSAEEGSLFNVFIISMNGASVNGCILSVVLPDTEDGTEEFTLLSTVKGKDLLA